MERFEIEFWGVRGSIATPGPTTAIVGGNTSSVEVRCGATRLILDAGTGIRRLGERLLREQVSDVTLLLSHQHWDHIQGLPFFVPLYLPTTRLAVFGAATEGKHLADVLAQQMSAPVFPVRWDELASRLEVQHVRAGQRFEVGAATVTVAKLNHPGGVLAYRIDYGGRSVVYATDTEHYDCVDPTLRRLAEGADVLIYDAMYTPEEYRGEAGASKVGWGHSTYEAGAKVAEAAQVGTLLLFHHEPTRTDGAVDELERLARARFPRALAAREGLCLDLTRVARAA